LAWSRKSNQELHKILKNYSDINDVVGINSQD